LYHRFVNGAEFWEIHELLRKMIFTGVLVYIPPNVRPSAALLVCILACCTLNYFEPYKNQLIFWIAELMFVLTMVKYLVCVFGMSMGSKLDANEMEYLGYLLIGLDVICILGCLVCIILVFCLMKISHEEIVAEEEMSDSSSEDEEDQVKPAFLNGISMHSLKHAVKLDKVRSIKQNSAQHKRAAINKLTTRLEAADARMQKRLAKRRRMINGRRIKQGLAPLYGYASQSTEDNFVGDGLFGEGRKDHVDTLFDDLHATEHLEVDMLFDNLHESEEHKLLESKSEASCHVDSLFDDIYESEHHAIDDLFEGLDEFMAVSNVNKPMHQAPQQKNVAKASAKDIEEVRLAIVKSVKNQNRLRKIIKRLDVDGSGKLSQEEFWPLVEYMLKGDSRFVLTETLVDGVWFAIEKLQDEIGDHEISVWLGFVKPVRASFVHPTASSDSDTLKKQIKEFESQVKAAKKAARDADDEEADNADELTDKYQDMKHELNDLQAELKFLDAQLNEATPTTNEIDHTANVEKVRVLMKNMIKNKRRLLQMVKMIDADDSNKISFDEFSKLATKVLKKHKEIDPSVISFCWKELLKHRKDMSSDEIGEHELCVWLEFVSAETPASEKIVSVPAIAEQQQILRHPEDKGSGSRMASPQLTEEKHSDSSSEHLGDAEKVRVQMKKMIKDEKRLQGIIKMIDADNSSKLSEAEFSKLAMKVLKKQKEVVASPGLLSVVWQEVRKHRKDMTQEEIGEQELCVWLQLKENGPAPAVEKKEDHSGNAEKVRVLMQNMIKTEKRLLGIIKMIDADNSSKLSEAEFGKLCKKVLKKQKEVVANVKLLSVVWQEVRKHRKDMNHEEIGEEELIRWLELKSLQ
jgi:hypothetical protein